MFRICKENNLRAETIVLKEILYAFKNGLKKNKDDCKSHQFATISNHLKPYLFKKLLIG